MLYNYIKVGSNKIVRATPDGYAIKELKTPSGYWTSYETHEFTDRAESDFTVVNTTPRTVINPFDVFVQKKSVTAKNSDDGTVDNALNIDSYWDKRFPETIRLKYPGVITNNNLSERKKFKKEEVYTFKIWENRSTMSLDNAKVIPDDTLPNIINTTDYFYDLQTFIKLDNGTSYEEWLKRPSFSLKNLLTKGIYRDGNQKGEMMYQLYKINDTNVQSLSTDFDEYIPWCFDQCGVKISQYKIATITSFNKKEIYILLEIRKEDVKEYGGVIEIPKITEVIFWRSGLSDSRITMDIRNKDQMLLLKDGKESNISEYFKESRMKTNTLVSFQKDRLENEIEDMTPVDNNDEKNTYELEYNSDPYFNIEKAKNVSRKIIFGRKDDISLNVSMGGNVFSDHSKNRVHVFVDGNLLTNDEFYILEGYVISTLASANSYVEIYINQYTSISYSFTLATAKSSLTQDELSYILYNNGFLWKTKQDKEYLLFNKDTFGSKSVNGSSVLSGNYLIIHSLFYNMDDTTTPTPTFVVNTVDLDTDLSDSRDYNINYDPMLFKTSKFNGNGSIKDKDIWIFDNTKPLIKISDNEPYLFKDNDNKIKVMNQVDKNIDLVVDADIVGLKNALTAGNVHKEILSAAEKDYLKLHYNQMSTVNRNILNMFLYSGINTWSILAPNTPIKIKKDYMVIRYTGTDDFPLLTVHKQSLYQYNTALDNVQVKVKPVKIIYNYYILHRTDEAFANLYEYSFNKQIDYIII